MIITFDPAKRQKTLDERGLDFRDADLVLADWHLTFEDTRADYGETRLITLGRLIGRMVVIGWTPRGNDAGALNAHVFSMRKANDREIKRYEPLIPRPGPHPGK